MPRSYPGAIPVPPEPPQGPQNAEWCPICYGWQKIAVGGCGTDHYLDFHREWLLAPREKPHPSFVNLTRRLIRR